MSMGYYSSEGFGCGPAILAAITAIVVVGGLSGAILWFLHAHPAHRAHVAPPAAASSRR